MSNVVKDLRKLSRTELESKVTELRQQLVGQKQARLTGELQDMHAVGRTRHQVAVALTLLGEMSKTEAAPKEKK